MSKLTEAIERVLAGQHSVFTYDGGVAEVPLARMDALRTALTEARAEEEARDRVIEAARRYAEFMRPCVGRMAQDASAVIVAVDALDAATRPRYRINENDVLMRGPVQVMSLSPLDPNERQVIVHALNNEPRP